MLMVQNCNDALIIYSIILLQQWLLLSMSLSWHGTFPFNLKQLEKLSSIEVERLEILLNWPSNPSLFFFFFLRYPMSWAYLGPDVGWVTTKHRPIRWANMNFFRCKLPNYGGKKNTKPWKNSLHTLQKTWPWNNLDEGRRKGKSWFLQPLLFICQGKQVLVYPNY